MRLAGAGATAETGALPALRYAGIPGRQLELIAAGLPLGGQPTGCYQALGDQKAALVGRGMAIVLEDGFDAIRPAAMIFEHCPHGPFAQLAVSHGLRGPFHVFEGGAQSTAFALAAALADLRRGRCAQALVGGFTVEPARAWLLLLAPGGELEARCRFGLEPRDPPPEDPLGLGSVIAALDGRGGAVQLGRAELAVTVRR